MSELPVAGEWDRLLDRLEQRLRLIESSVRPQRTGPVEIGPPVEDADRPSTPPTPAEHLRLLALVAEHDRLIGRMESQRRSLRQAQYYRMAGA